MKKATTKKHVVAKKVGPRKAKKSSAAPKQKKSSPATNDKKQVKKTASKPKDKDKDKAKTKDKVHAPVPSDERIAASDTKKDRSVVSLSKKKPAKKK